MDSGTGICIVFLTTAEANMKYKLLMVSIFAISFAELSIHDQWTAFKVKHGKSYRSPNEENFRRSVFSNNLQLIAEHNEKFSAGLFSYSLEMNHLGDLTPEEVTTKLNSSSQLKNQSLNFSLGYVFPANVELPEFVDWIQAGAVTPVKNQGHCGACWAFSSTGALEGQLARATGVLTPLSEQQLLDCAGMSCNGGIMEQAFDYVHATGGLSSEDVYPYEAKVEKCKVPNSVSGSSVRGYVDLPSGNEAALLSAVATVGPVSVGVSGSPAGFRFYKSGIFTGETCDPKKLDHAVLVVGYGSQNDQDFWIIKNSWSTVWGEEGYMRLGRNMGNLCGIASAATYPVL